MLVALLYFPTTLWTFSSYKLDSDHNDLITTANLFQCTYPCFPCTLTFFLLLLGHAAIAVSEGTKVALMAIRSNATNKLCHARGSSPSVLTTWLTASTLDLYV